MSQQKTTPSEADTPKTPEQDSPHEEADATPTPPADEEQNDDGANPERQRLIAEAMEIRRAAQERLLQTLTFGQYMKLRLLAEKMMGFRK